MELHEYLVLLPDDDPSLTKIDKSRCEAWRDEV